VAWNDACCLDRSSEPPDQSNGLCFRPKWTSRPPDPAFSWIPGPKNLDIQQKLPVGMVSTKPVSLPPARGGSHQGDGTGEGTAVPAWLAARAWVRVAARRAEAGFGESGWGKARCGEGSGPCARYPAEVLSMLFCSLRDGPKSGVQSRLLGCSPLDGQN